MTNMLKSASRMALALPLLAAFGAAPAAVQAQDLAPLTVVLPYVPNVESFGTLYAERSGFFEEEGLDVTVIPAGVGVDQIQMVVAGVAQIGIAIPESILAAVDKGEKLKVIAGLFQKQPSGIACREDAGVTTAADIVGKRVGVKTNGNMVWLQLFMQKNNLSMDSIQTTPVGPTDISLLLANQIDCLATIYTFSEPFTMEQQGLKTNVLLLADSGVNAQADSYVVREDFIADPKNKDLLVRYLRAELRGWEEFFRDPKAAAEYIVNGKFYDGLDMDQQVYEAGEMGAYMTSPLTAEKGLLWIDRETWEGTAENALAAELTSTKVDIDQVLTTEILELVQPFKK